MIKLYECYTDKELTDTELSHLKMKILKVMAQHKNVNRGSSRIGLWTPQNVTERKLNKWGDEIKEIME